MDQQETTTSYRNQWHRPEEPHYGPAVYETRFPSQPYRGFDVYERMPNVFDVVKDGVCVGQFAGYDGAKRNIDAYLDGEATHYLDVPEAEAAPATPGM